MLNSSARNERFHSDEVAQNYAAWPDEIRHGALELRRLIFAVCGATEGAGKLVETLKWNVPAYLTEKPKSGTTLRVEAQPGAGTYGLFVPCQTSLIEQCRDLYADIFRYEKNRGLIFAPNETLPEPELRHFIAMALTYHLKSRAKQATVV
ncbi:MAG TPA: DUF1801 domain-containing protein [Devosia sp.]|nr:DUF1801 domain-containing protein [Devosia sp.]